jgi:diguanylate cyclase (GGDEF)-like protein
MDETEDFAKAAYIEGENKTLFKNKCIKPGEGATGFVLKKRQPVYKIEPELDFTFNKSDQDYTAMTSLPLIANERLLGAVSLYSLELDNYEEEHLRLLETVSRIASDAIGMSLQHAESESRALTDPMTDLPNARSLQMQFEKEAARASRNGSGFQLLMLDLDGFKAVNDTFGHKAGDKLLKELSKVMLGQLRDYDFLARYAGDEFVAIVPETDAEGIQDLCQRMEKAVNDFSLPVGDDRFAKVGISIGAAAYPFNGDALDQVVIAADKAMYAVKADRKQAKATQQLPSIEEVIVPDENFIVENFIVELDESHIISSAIN